MDTQIIKISIIDQFMLAVSKIKEYPKLVKQKMGRAVNYAFLVTLLITCIAYLIPLFGFHISIGGYEKFFLESIPSFAIENGEMKMDGKIDINMGGVVILADSSKQEYTSGDLKEDAMLQLLISKSNVILYEFGKAFEIKLSSLSQFKVTNQTLVEFIPALYVGEVFSILIMLVIQFFRYLVGACGYAILGLSLASMRKVSLSFSELVKIGIYGKTLAAIAGAINEAMGYPIGVEYWYSVGMCISLFYVIRGIAAHDSSRNEPTANLMQ